MVWISFCKKKEGGELQIYEETDYLRQLLVIVNVQSNNLRGDKKNNKRHFFERLSITLQRENGSMLLERCPLLAADVDGDF